ncbi:MAG: hypothetical protein LN410_03355 [Candidatus Thermoplasmatota archaeon]|nr:hypothetical protein [Candidatus Thermoplasmatota archaeon]
MGLLERLEEVDTKLEDLREAIQEILDDFDETYEVLSVEVVEDEYGAEHLRATFDLRD